MTSRGSVPLHIEVRHERALSSRIAQTIGELVRDGAPGVATAALRDLGAVDDDEAYVGQVLPGRDPIASWANDAAEQAERGLRLDGAVRTLSLPSDNLGLAFFPDHGRASAAWHDDTFAIVEFPAGLRSVQVSYDESGAAKACRRAAIRELGGSVPARLLSTLSAETSLDWYCYTGEDTVGQHGSWRVDSTVPYVGPRSIKIETAGRPGMVHLKPWQWLGQRLDKPLEDRWMGTRLATYVAKLGSLVDQHPEVGEARDGSLIGPIVWVHGTSSCGLVHLRQLIPLVPPGHPVFRFEHDTFQDINDNGAELGELLHRKLAPASRGVVLLAHSRGGLVARVAAALLASDRPKLEITLVTLGTPHQGTPLVNAGHRVLKAMVAMTSFGLGATPIPDPASMLLKYLAVAYGAPRWLTSV
jgi:hypothetical protein